MMLSKLHRNLDQMVLGTFRLEKNSKVHSFAKLKYSRVIILLTLMEPVMHVIAIKL